MCKTDLNIFPSVCAEAFNPDEDDEDTEPRVVHPKTDEQRCRLQEACRDILLFKTLDQVWLMWKCTQIHIFANTALQQSVQMGG